MDTGNNARITYRIVPANSYNNITVASTTTAAAAAAATSSSQQMLNSLQTLDAEIAQIFGIFPNSGWIYLRGTLDRESRDRYELTVQASDNGTPPAHARTRVVVSVLDANDNDPRFLRSSAYEFSIEENLRRGSLVGVVSATDADLNENAAIRYSLIPSNSSFQVNPVTGK